MPAVPLHPIGVAVFATGGGRDQRSTRSCRSRAFTVPEDTRCTPIPVTLSPVPPPYTPFSSHPIPHTRQLSDTRHLMTHPIQCSSGVRTRYASPVADAGGMVLRVLSACALGDRPLTLLRKRDASSFVDCVFRQVQSECQSTPWAEPTEDLAPSDVANPRTPHHYISSYV